MRGDNESDYNISDYRAYWVNQVLDNRCNPSELLRTTLRRNSNLTKGQKMLVARMGWLFGGWAIRAIRGIA